MEKKNFILLMLGLLGELHIQIIGSIAISELIMFVIAPVIFINDFGKLRRHGFMPYFFCVWLAILGCVISSVANSTPFPMAIRGLAGAYALFAMPVVMHRCLSNNLSGLKWIIVGFALSCFISIFGLQSSVDLAAIGNAGVGEKPELYYAKHYGALFSIWYKGWYLQCPTIIAAILMLLPIVQIIISSSSGRSALLSALFGLFLLFFVRRSVFRMRLLKNKILFVCGTGVVIVLMLTQLYKYAAINGFLNEAAQKKYEYQTRKGGGPLALIMSGRADFFIGMTACFNRPILGHGPWASDDGGYIARFLEKYGDSEDYERYYGELQFRRKMGLSQSIIPAHSHIIGFWLWYGILALPLWPYVLKKLLEYLHLYLDAIPQWFGVLAIGSPGFVWGCLFSPFGGRFIECLYITCLLIAIAVGKGRIQLPYEMQREALKQAR